MSEKSTRERWRSVAGAEIQLAAKLAIELEAVTTPAASVGEALLERARAEDGVVSDLLLLDACVLLLDAETRQAHAQWGQPLVPTRTVDGEPFMMEDVPDELEQFAVLRAASPRPEVAGRWSDIRWLRWGRHSAVGPAINGYLAAASAAAARDVDHLDSALSAFRRAADLALRIDESRRPAVCRVVRSALEGWAGMGFSVFVLELTEAAAAVLSSEPAEAVALGKRLFADANTPTASIGARQIFEAVEHLAHAGGANDLWAEARRARAASHEREGNERGGLARIHFLREAIDLYQQIGDRAALDRLRESYAEAGREALAELRPIETTITIQRREIEAAVDQLRLSDGPSLAGYILLPFELGILDDWARVREDRQQEEAAAPFSSVFPRTSLEADGRIQPEPDRDARPGEYEHARDVSFFGRRTTINAGIFEMTYLTELRHRRSWSAPLVASAIGIVDEDLAAACFPGIVRYEAGDHWNAAHALTPQIERALRALGRKVGADQARFGRNEQLRWATFEQLARDEGIVEHIGAHRAAALEALFVNPQGPNWRHNLAHGALATDSQHSAITTVSLLSILALCYFIAEADRQTAMSAK